MEPKNGKERSPSGSKRFRGVLPCGTTSASRLSSIVAAQRQFAYAPSPTEPHSTARNVPAGSSAFTSHLNKRIEYDLVVQLNHLEILCNDVDLTARRTQRDSKVLEVSQRSFILWQVEIGDPRLVSLPHEIGFFLAFCARYVTAAVRHSQQIQIGMKNSSL